MIAKPEPQQNHLLAALSPEVQSRLFPHLELVPLGAVPVGTSRGSLAVIELDEPWARRDLKVCVRKREALSGFSAALLACLLGEG